MRSTSCYSRRQHARKCHLCT